MQGCYHSGSMISERRPMFRRLFPAGLRAPLAAVLMTAALGAAAQAATVPSNLMLPDPTLASHGVVERWVLNIKLEATDLKALEPCRALLAQHGFAPVLSKTATSTMPELHFKIEGNKEYAQASTDADEALAAVQGARCGGALSWAVTSRPVPR